MQLEFISCLGATELTSNGAGNIAYWDKDKNYIGGFDKSNPNIKVIKENAINK